MPAVSKGPNKWDVEMQRLLNRREVGRIRAYGLVVALCIAASALPLWMVQGIVRPLAGKTTHIDASIAISVAITISVVVNGLQWLKDRSQKRELRRLRRRAEELEKALAPGV
jgi:hypothetical protein